jgi:hypothetical protein
VAVTADILKFRRKNSLAEAIEDALKDHPDATDGIIMVFDKEGGIRTFWHCDRQQMSFASVRLGYLAGKGDDI